MRVIAGKAKGRKLQAPPGMKTRPITDMIKEALFNILRQNVPDSTFMDLYAGSGSVGIEALSRGAAKVVFVDNDYQAINVLKQNLAKCGLQGEVYRNDVFDFLKGVVRSKLTFDIIYADPPFTQKTLFERTLHSLDNSELLNAGGVVIIRVPRNTELPSRLNWIEMDRKNTYGESVLYFYRSVKGEVPYNGDFQNP